MSLFSEYMTGSITTLTERELVNVSAITANAFYCGTDGSTTCPLTSISFPSSVKTINAYAFCNSTLQNVNSDSLDPYCFIRMHAFDGTPFVNNITAGSMLYMSNGRILVSHKISKPSTNLSIPDTVVNIASRALYKYSEDTNFKKCVIPDTVEILGDNIFDEQSTLTSITVGASVRRIGVDLTPSNSVTTLIFRQPAGMYVELPPAGDGEFIGLAYNKNSRNVSIYTDNECIKNYDWATDNVTATFYPLSSAPA